MRYLPHEPPWIKTRTHALEFCEDHVVVYKMFNRSRQWLMFRYEYCDPELITKLYTHLGLDPR